MFAILRASKLKTKSQISGSGSHTYRDIPPLNADPKLTRLNQHGQVQSAEGLLSAISARLPAGRRKDAVLAIEYLVGASPEWFTSQQRNAGNDYFSDALRWIVQRHGEPNVVGWAVHRDEGAPHLVCYVVPLDPQTGRLNASRWLDGRQKLSQMQTEFADAVGRRHGLERGIEGSRATHQKVRQWYKQIMRPDPVVNFSPQDLQLRQGETLVACAARLNAKIETELEPIFSAAKVSKSATSLAKSMVSTAKALRRQHDQIICAPVLRLHSASPGAFDELMNQVSQQLQRLPREARIKREDIRPQLLARTVSQDKDKPASRDKTAPDIVEPNAPAALSPVAPASDFQPDFDWSVGLDL